MHQRKELSLSRVVVEVLLEQGHEQQCGWSEWILSQHAAMESTVLNVLQEAPRVSVGQCVPCPCSSGKRLTLRVADCAPASSGVVVEDTVVVAVPMLLAGPSRIEEQTALRDPSAELLSSVACSMFARVQLLTELPSGISAVLHSNSAMLLMSSELLLDLGLIDHGIVSIDDGYLCLPVCAYDDNHDGDASSDSAAVIYCNYVAWTGLWNWFAQVLCNCDEDALPASLNRSTKMSALRSAMVVDLDRGPGASLLVPMNCFKPLRRGTLNRSSLLPSSAADDDCLVRMTGTASVYGECLAKKIVVVPAHSDKWMQAHYGESYADMLSSAIECAARRGDLDGMYVFEDAVVTVQISADTNAASPSDWTTSVLQRAENCMTVARHVAKLGVAAAAGSATHAVQLRVALVGTDRPCIPGGVIRTSGSVVTEIVLAASSAHCLARDEGLVGLGAPPLFCAVSGLARRAPFHCAPPLSLGESAKQLVPFGKASRRARRFIAHAWQGRKAASIGVVHGSPENACFEQVFNGCVSLGASTIIFDARSSAFHWVDDVLSAVRVSAATASPNAVIVRHAQAAIDDGDNAATFDAIVGALQSIDAVYPVVLFLLSETGDAQLHPKLAAVSEVAPVCVTVPDERERELVVRTLLHDGVAARQWNISRFLSFATVAEWTQGLPLSDVVAYVLQAIWQRLQEVGSHCTAESDDDAQGGGDCTPVIDEALMEETLKSFQRSHGHNLSSTKLQPVRWSDVGGLETAKREILETIQLPITHPELFASGCKRRAGVLLYGPPGCGKTLIAKAVATEMNINFLSVKGPELINQYVGESERNVRNLFQKARENAPCIIFFDELDALVPARGAKGDAGGAMDRIVAQLLVEVDGVAAAGGALPAVTADSDDDHVAESCSTAGDLRRVSAERRKDIFIIGATNRPDLLDPALMRPGRFDRLCYIGMPSTKAEQLFAVKALTRKFKLAPDVSLEEVVAPLDFVYTGADFFALCSDAMMLAVDEVVASARETLRDDCPTKTSECNDDGDEESEDVVVSMKHFEQSRLKLKASVSSADLEKYESLRRTFSRESHR